MPVISAEVVDYPARDMTITVGAGMTHGALASILAKEQQQLPIDVASDDITVGQMVAVDVCGPRMFGYGTLRDYVIGIEAVDGGGRVFHAGGRVVKNVAGYDLCRLLVGSRGELGTITQVTFKLKPVPAASGHVLAAVTSFDALRGVLERLNTSAATPVILDVVSAEVGRSLSFPDYADRATDEHCVAWLVIGIEGPSNACVWQADTLRNELHSLATTIACSAECIGVASASNGIKPWEMADYSRSVQALSLASSTTDWLARVTLLPSRVGDCCEAIASKGGDFFGRAGNGVLYVRPLERNGSAVPARREPSQAAARAFDADSANQLLHSFVREGAGSVTAIAGDGIQPTMPSLAVAKISNHLRELLGAKSA